MLVVDYDSEAAAAIAGEVGGAAFAADVTDPDACLAMVAAALEAFGRPDVAVNNAGVGPAGLIPTADISIEDWRRVLATNLDGVFYSMRAEIPALLRTGRWLDRQHVVGDRGRRPRRCAAYAASKHGVLGLTRTAAIEYGREGIRVNTVGPGTTETPLTRDAIASEGEKIVGRVPLGRVAVPEDIAPLVVFLASDASAFCTGGWYAVDGGWTPQ